MYFVNFIWIYESKYEFCLEYMQLFNITEKITYLEQWVFSPLQSSPFCNSLTQYSTF